jgi:UDP-N-acetylmuramoylalanine--D-glutamate ligase
MQFDTSVFSDLENTNIALLGLGREAQSTYSFFETHMPGKITFILADEKPLSELGEFWQKLVGADTATFSLLSELDWSGIDFAAVSPGISDQKIMVEYEKPEEIAVITNTDLFFELAETAEVALITIGITGTKGKSTTTAGIHHVLKELNAPVVLGGNIGVPPLDLIDKLRQLELEADQKAFAVLELSSHQLSRVTHSPDIAVVQAVTPEHLDYYPSFEDYLEAKKSVARFQTTTDVVFFNAESETAREIAQSSQGMQRGFTADMVDFDQSRLQIVGQHSVLNLVPAVLVAEYLHYEPQAAIDKLYSFTGLPHRLQLVFEKSDGTKYYNDSLATTPEAAVAAISSFDKPIVLIAGGYDRTLDYTELGAFLSSAADEHKLRGVVYFPPSGKRIVDAIKNENVPKVKVESMAEAVAEANKLAKPGDIVLLSPASASFGRFKNYADRGEQFTREAQA